MICLSYKVTVVVDSSQDVEIGIGGFENILPAREALPSSVPDPAA
jgi:hypothetical protein